MRRRGGRHEESSGIQKGRLIRAAASAPRALQRLGRLRCPATKNHSTTSGTRDEGAITESASRPIEAIIRLRIDTGARCKTFSMTKRIDGSTAIGRAARRNRAALAS
jgi:hypothetical protein